LAEERRALKAVFLCGGTGRRMFPSTETKYLPSSLSKSLLERQTDQVAQAGVRDFLAILSHAASQQLEEVIGMLDGISA
ncbi:MAG: sugar phosphate nucleotidyltransferase, partial [Dehalococcoidia bacterium]|nr:sugar phosphate nucleotidyltransferase [Dehalococcoidia bacterium]